MADELRADRSPAEARGRGHALPRRDRGRLSPSPGQHFICSYLEERDVLPAFRAGMRNIAPTSSVTSASA